MPAAFDQAVVQAQKAGFRVAWSNECFEIWYLLHFEYCDASRSREQYQVPLSGYLGAPYQKNDREMYNRLLRQQSTAIRNARRLIEFHGSAAPSRQDPCTHVVHLVEELNKHLRP